MCTYQLIILCINANLSKNNECLDGMTTCSWRFQNLASSIKQATFLSPESSELKQVSFLTTRTAN